MRFIKMERFEPEIWLFNGIRSDSFNREKETTEWARKMEDAVLYDIGANVGVYSLIAAKDKKNVKVYAFEPMISNFGPLIKNVKHNGLEDSIFPINIPLSDEVRTDWFYYRSFNIGKSGSVLSEPVNCQGLPFKPLFKQFVITHTIDNMVDMGLEPPDFIKLDVDGAEYRVLQGATKTLDSVKSILVEIDNPEDLDRTTKLMADHGLKLASTHPHTTIMNVIFER